MAPHASACRRRRSDIRSHVFCAPAFAARPVPVSTTIQLACAPYVPQHSQQQPPKGPTHKELRALPPAVAAILASPEPKVAAKEQISTPGRQAPSPTGRQVSETTAAAAAGDQADSRPAKRVCCCAGPQPIPPLRLPHPAAARLLLQAACAPFDLSLEPALQYLAPPTAPLAVPHVPAAAHGAAVRCDDDGGGGGSGTGHSSSRQDGQSRPPPPPPPLLPVFAHPASRTPTPQQAAVLRACSDADAGLASAARPLTTPAALVGTACNKFVSRCLSSITAIAVPPTALA